MRRLPVLLLLLWVCATFYTGIYLFVGGFMLVRLEVNRSSSCSDVLPPGDQAGRFCSGEPRFRRAVLLIIDALKINFAQFDPTNVMPLPFENKLPVLQEVTESQPTNSRLFAFRADPPTTTMQRIKGFTTGSLPTFIDVGNNFASNSILEDNLVHQLGEAGKRVVFMGDDTWESLFPKKFHRSLPFPSFNVKDLHTVDDGILKHLYPTLQSSDWDVLIAHFLGVDHCGHRFGPNHPAMADKLMQMDEVIRSVIRLIKNDTLLVVMGDHGMTDTGDHGGESLKETDAALFLYSPTPLFPPFGSQVEPEVVPQTDLVPTLALLLGIPIPYSSIGQVLLPIFPQHTDAAGTQPHLTQAEALWINSKQVNRFLETYAHMARDISPESLSLLQERFAGLAAEYRRALQEGRVPSPALLNGLQAYLSAVRDVCRATWARFHPLKILSGLLLLATTCLVTLGVSELPRLAGGVEGPSLAPPVVVGVLAGGAVVTVQLMSVGWAEAGWFLGTAAFASQSVFLWRLLRAGRWAKASQIQRCGWRRLLLPLPCVPLLILFLRCASLLSDSYVIAEGRVVTFLLLSLGFYVPLRLNWDGLLFLPSPDPQKPPCPFPPVAPCSSSATRRESLALLACMGVLAASAYVVPSLAACREEQGDCEPSPLLLPLSRVQDGRARNLRYALSVASLAAWTCLLRLWLRRCGNLNGPGPAVLVARWVFPLAAVSVALHWAVDATPEDTFRGLADLIALALTALPRATFTLLGLGAALLWWDPLTVFLKARSLAGPSPAPRYRASTGVSTQAELRHLIPQLYQRMRLSLEDGGQPGALGMDGRPAVEAYGLGTVYSAALLLLAGLLGLGLLLLHPEGVSLAFVLLLLEGAALLQLHASSSNLVALQGALMGGFSVPWVQVILWDLAAIQFFHGTGHLPTFPSIQWGAAFVGFPKGHSGTLLPAALVTLNTFSSNILFAVGCPLLLFWPLVYEVRGGQRGGRGHIADGEEGDDTVMEMRLRERPADFSATLLQLAMRYLFVKGAQVLASALAAAILRRHLMVWRVFAPKLMFEASGFVVASVFILISFTLVMRVDIAVNSWFKRLIPEQSR